MDGNNRKRLPDERKGMQSPGKIEKCVEENPCQSEEGALHGIGNFVWVSNSGRGEVCGSREKFIGGEAGAERQMRLLRAHGSAELGKITSGSASQGL